MKTEKQVTRAEYAERFCDYAKRDEKRDKSKARQKARKAKAATRKAWQA